LKLFLKEPYSNTLTKYRNVSPLFYDCLSVMKSFGG
jgi:hypothetical protein